MTKTGGREAQSEEERQALGRRVSALRARLGERIGKRVTQDQIAEKGAFPRSDMSFFEQGRKLSSHENIKKLAGGFGISLDAFSAYLENEIDADEALARSQISELPQPTVSREDLSPNAVEAMQAFTWDGVPAEEYSRVHAGLAATHFADGIDPVPSWWNSEIRRLLREGKPTAKSVHQREPVESPEERDAAELAAYKASRKAAREAAKKAEEEAEPEPPKKPGRPKR